MEQYSQREISSKLFRSLSIRKQWALNIIQNSDDVMKLIYRLLEGQVQAHRFSKSIKERQLVTSKFMKLKSLNRSVSVDDFEIFIKKLAEQIDKTLENEQKGIKQVQVNHQSQIEFGRDYNKKIEIQRQEEEIDINSLYKVDKQNKYLSQDRKIEIIDCSKIKVQVKYQQDYVNLEDYQYNGYNLKQTLVKYIKTYLKQNVVYVLTKSSFVTIMQDTRFVKSDQAGYYRFNPYCDVVEINLNIQFGEFKNNFSVSGDLEMIKISFTKVAQAEWNKGYMRLTLKSSVKELTEQICKKRQTPDKVNQLEQGLINAGGAHTIQDLSRWKRQDFSHINVMATYIIEIQDLVQQIKNRSQGQTRKKALCVEKKNCLKVSNSHKILRYIVYQTEGIQGIQKIAWLNLANLREAIKIIKQQIFNDELLDQLQDFFNQYALDPHHHVRPISFQRGLVLFGPPGTGKTVLTEALPNIMGFHLIQRGLSAADFMKSLVGESSRMILALANRASQSPHLLCSIAIDEVDGLVPDRKDKDEKNKGEGISMLLSVIQGIRDVSNLVFMTSTNYIRKIDEAIKRRLSGQYLVGRPNPSARKKIIQKNFTYIRGKNVLMNHLIKISTNFTGAALCRLAMQLQKILSIKKTDKKQAELSIDQITDAGILIANQFSIKLGEYTLPQIYKYLSAKKYIFTDTFFSRIGNHFLMVKYSKDDEYSIGYYNELKRYQEGRVIQFYETQNDRININVQVLKGRDFYYFCQFIELTFSSVKYQVKKFQNYTRSQIKRYLNQRKKDCHKRQKTIIMIVKDQKGYYGDVCVQAQLNNQEQQNMFIIYYLTHQVSMKAAMQCFKKNPNTTIQNKREIPNNNFKGRILVELNQQSRMAFQLNTISKAQSMLAFKWFLKSSQTTTPAEVIPELIDFFTKKEVSYILLINYDVLLQCEAYQEKKILEVLGEKMMQAKNYRRVAVIIDLDSLVSISQNNSDSNFGRSTSYDIRNHNIVQMLQNYMVQFAEINGQINRWMTVIVKHPQLTKMVKKRLDWPKTPEQILIDKEEQAANEEKYCIRCSSFYTQKDNKEERKCKQHYGQIYNNELGLYESEKRIQILKAKVIKMQRLNEKYKDPFLYTCCMGNLDKQGCRTYHHIDQLRSKDEMRLDQTNFKDLGDKVIQALYDQDELI